MNNGSCMMLTNKDSSLTRIPCETKKYIYFERKEEHGMDNFLDMGLGNYVFLEDITNTKPTDQIFDGLWKIFFDGAFSKNGLGIETIIESPKSKIKPHAFELQFECTNNEAEYEALIQGLEFAKSIKIRYLYVFRD